MANYIEYAAQLTPQIFVTPTSRYNNSKVLYYGDDKKITFTTYKKREIVQSEDDKFLVIPETYAYRPDLVSYKIYATPDYWWKIMEYNSISDIADFVGGRTIRIPSNYV